MSENFFATCEIVTVSGRNFIPHFSLYRMSPFALPPGYPRIKTVGSFQELASTPFADGVNALCWPRVLPGDFREIVGRLDVSPGINNLDVEQVASLPVSAAGRAALDVLVEDQQLLRSLDLSPSLDCVEGSLRADDPAPVRTDVYSFHVDSATVEADTWLCTYHGAASEGLRNDEAVRRVDIPETRAELLQVFGGDDDEAFLEYLNDHYYDLHYTLLPQAQLFSFGLGNFWRIATEYPGSPVPPCIHRAPLTLPGMPRRLLLIS